MNSFTKRHYQIQWKCEACGHRFGTIVRGGAHLVIPPCSNCGEDQVWLEEAELQKEGAREENSSEPSNTCSGG